MTISVSIALRKCEHVFSEAPCTATGTPCYNTRRTCQDVPNYSGITEQLTLRLASGEDVEAGARAYLLSVRHTSQKMAPEGLSDFNDRVDLTIQDAPGYDQDDPYSSKRESAQGSWWGRLLARHPYIVGNAATLDVDGVVTHWEVSSVSQPDETGIARIALQSPIPRLLKTHIPNSKLPSLVGQIAATGVPVVPATVPVDSYFRIDDEMFHKTAGTVTRGQFNTQQTDHAAGSEITPCIVFENKNVVILCFDLLEAAGAGNLAPENEFIEEMNNGLTARVLSAFVIEEATPLVDCLKAILPLAPMTLTWDAVANKIRPRARGPWTTSPRLITDKDVVSLIGNNRQPPRAVLKSDLQATRVFVRYGPRSPTDRDLLGVAVAVDVEAEGQDLHGRNFDYEIECDRVMLRDRQLAESAASGILRRRNNINRLPLELAWRLRSSVDNPIVGDVVDLCFADVIQQPNGEPETIRAQVSSARIIPEQGITQFNAISYLPDQDAEPEIITVNITTNQTNYNLRTAVPTSFPVRVVVNIGSGVIISGGVDASAAAFSAVGFHPDSQITITLDGASIRGAPARSVVAVGGDALSIGLGEFTLRGTGTIIGGFTPDPLGGVTVAPTGYAIRRSGGIIHVAETITLIGERQ